MNATETDIIPPDEINGELRMETWVDIIFDESDYSNEDFWDDFDEIAKQAYEEQRQVRVIFSLEDGGGNVNTITPPQRSESEKIDRMLENVRWSQILHMIGDWSNVRWKEQLDNACYDAWTDNKKLKFIVTLV